MADKRMTEEDVVGRLRSGMTIGIGGWGSRRKPMSLVRAILRSDLTDLTVVSYGGPDVGLLCAAGKVRKLVFGFVSLDSIPLDPLFRAARQQGADRGRRVRRGHGAAWPARGGDAAAVPAHQGRPGLAGRGHQPRAAHDHRPLRGRGAGRDAGAEARRRPRAHEPGRREGQCPVPRARPVLRRPLLRRRRRGLRVVRADRAHRRADEGRPPGDGPHLPHAGHRGGRGAATARTSPPACPTTTGTRSSSAPTSRQRATRTGGRRSASASSKTARPDTSARSPRSRQGRRRDASGKPCHTGRRPCRGVRHRLRRGIPRRRGDPRLPHRPDPDDRRAPGQAHLRAAAARHRRRGPRRRGHLAGRRPRPPGPWRAGCPTGRSSTSSGGATGT